MLLEQAILRVQSAYPRIYLACHQRHQTPRVTGEELSARDSTILSHLDEERPLRQVELTRHLGIAKSTMSEALAWLEQRGFIERRAEAGIVRSKAGSAAMGRSSVLETGRLTLLLNALSDDERVRAVEGLELLARAAVSVPKEEA